MDDSKTIIRVKIQMKKKIILILTFFFFLNACLSTNEFDEFDLNTIDLTRITGEPYTEPSVFDSAIWPALVSTLLLIALSSGYTSSGKTPSNPAEMDSEWIE